MKRESLMLYPNCKEMTWKDARTIRARNAKNGYGITYAEMKRLAKAHEKARKSGDVRTMEKIEYRLTDINFHHECARMHHAEYIELAKEFEEDTMNAPF